MPLTVTEAAVAQDRGFERQLRREPGLDLFLCRHRAGLVVDQQKAARGEAVDTVGGGGQLERPARARRGSAGQSTRSSSRRWRRGASSLRPTSQRTIRSKRGHQNAQAPGRDSTGPKSRARSPTVCAPASSGSSRGNGVRIWRAPRGCGCRGRRGRDRRRARRAPSGRGYGGHRSRRGRRARSRPG